MSQDDRWYFKWSFILAILAAIIWIATPADAQGIDWRIVDVLTADYDCDCWRLESTGQPLTVSWHIAHRFGDGSRFEITGSALELDAGLSIVFVSQRDSQHGLVALVLEKQNEDQDG